MVKHCTLFVFYVCFFPAFIFSQKKLDLIDLEAQQYANLYQLEAASVNNSNGSNIDEKYVRFNLTMSPSVSPATVTGTVTHYFTTTTDNVQTIKYDLYNVVWMCYPEVSWYHVYIYAVINHIVDTVVINLLSPISTMGTLILSPLVIGNSPKFKQLGYKRSLCQVNQTEYTLFRIFFQAVVAL
jgi:hypothetical protein